MNNIVLMTNFFLGKMRRTFFMSFPENNKDYKKSRMCYTVADSAAQTIVQLAGGTFLVTLMEALEISDGNMGIIASFGSFAAIAQIVSIKLSKRIVKNKLFSCITVLQKLWFAFMFFIPMMNMKVKSAQLLMMVCYCFAQISLQIGTPAIVDWVASLIPAKLRGRYFSIKDSIAVFVVVSSTLIMGIMLDILKGNYLNLAFIILGAAIAILALVNVVALAKMKEPKLSHVNEQGKEMMGTLVKKHSASVNRAKDVKLFQEIKIALQTKKFRQLLYLNCLWMTAFYIASPFNSSFQIKDLKLPYTFIMVVSFVTSMLRIYLTPKAGKLADKIGMATVMSWALAAMGLHYIVMAFSNPGNAYVCAVLASLASALGWTFIGIGMLGIQLECLAEDKRIVQYSLVAMFAGVYGFVISVLGGKLIDFIQMKQAVSGEYKIYAQMYTNLLGFFFIVVTITYLLRNFGKKSKA